MDCSIGVETQCETIKNDKNQIGEWEENNRLVSDHFFTTSISRIWPVVKLTVHQIYHMISSLEEIIDLTDEFLISRLILSYRESQTNGSVLLDDRITWRSERIRDRHLWWNHQSISLESIIRIMTSKFNINIWMHQDGIITLDLQNNQTLK